MVLLWPREAVPGAIQAWYADDCAITGETAPVAEGMTLLERLGSTRGYFPEPAKSIIICTQADMAARQGSPQQVRLQVLVRFSLRRWLHWNEGSEEGMAEAPERTKGRGNPCACPHRTPLPTGGVCRAVQVTSSGVAVHAPGH
jgi:hypothetical protein